MAENSAIEWTDHTFNPWEGCQRVGLGCDNCYAEARDQRFTGGAHWGPGAPRRLTSDANWRKPLKWDAAAKQTGTRPRVFCASLADVFDNAVDPAWRDRLWALIKATPNLDWLLLTKRPGNIANMLPADWGGGFPNVWLGCTVVNQAEADRDIPKLLSARAAVRFLSMEPLLGPVDLTSLPYGQTIGNAPTYQDALQGRLWMPAGTPNWPIDPRCTVGDRTYVDLSVSIDWVIGGGESGPKARPMHPDWARSLRDQCAAAGVAYLHKQNGEYIAIYDRDRDDPDWRRCSDIERKYQPGQWLNLAGGTGFHGERVVWVHRLGKKAAGRLLDGVTHDEFPGAV